MKNKKTLIAFAIMGMIGGTAHASQGAVYGQPFKALQSQIDANAALINANASAITELNGSVDAINTRIDGIDSSISALESQVALNTTAIEEANARIDTNEASISGLSYELANLAEQHAADIAAIGARIDDINAEIVNLNIMRRELAEQLNNKLAELQSRVDDNSLAIDSLLVDLVALNAQITAINSDILDLQSRQDVLDVAMGDYQEQLDDLNAMVNGLAASVETLQSYHLYTFSGIQTNLPVNDLNGWSECYNTNYADQNAHPEAMMASCTGSKIMLACRPTGSDTLTVAAYADRADVFMDTGRSNNVVHTANGVDWYFSPDYSMGFAPVGEGVRRSSADTQDQSSPYRLSWHTLDHYSAGWRCGSNVWLNTASNWEKVVYQAD